MTDACFKKLTSSPGRPKGDIVQSFPKPIKAIDWDWQCGPNSIVEVLIARSAVLQSPFVFWIVVSADENQRHDWCRIFWRKNKKKNTWNSTAFRHSDFESALSKTVDKIQMKILRKVMAS